MAALSRYLITDSINPAVTAASQWFERTLDDSANKRIAVSEAFLCCDAILSLYLNVASGLVVYPKVIEKHLRAELPFMATENILMDSVKRGGDRLDLHERIRQHSIAAGRVVKEEGGENDLLDRIASDPAFGVTREDLEKHMDPAAFTGCAVRQTEDFLREEVSPVLAHFGGADVKADIRV